MNRPHQNKPFQFQINNGFNSVFVMHQLFFLLCKDKINNSILFKSFCLSHLRKSPRICKSLSLNLGFSTKPVNECTYVSMDRMLIFPYEYSAESELFYTMFNLISLTVTTFCYVYSLHLIRAKKNGIMHSHFLPLYLSLPMSIKVIAGKNILDTLARVRK